MNRRRDTQRRRVYLWERAARGASMFQELMDLDECQAMVERVWPAERGRYGRANVPAPELQRVHRGQRAAIAYATAHAISLPRWARNPWVLLHELAHLLADGDRHGPRFVGVLIGLAARWMGADVDELLAQAEAGGVKVDRRAIGAVPTRTLADKVLPMLPGTPVEIAVQLNIEQGLGISYRQVRGAALRLIRKGQARFAGQTLVAVAA